MVFFILFGFATATGSPRLRRIGIVRCVAAFFFYIGVLALAISIIGNLVFQQAPG